MPKSIQKILNETKSGNKTELKLDDRGISHFTEYPEITTITSLSRLSLAHNKIKSLPLSISNLNNLTHLTLCNNHLQELPTSITKLENLISLNLSINKLKFLPKNFQFKNLQILDLSYNNLTENPNSLSVTLFNNFKLRALYLADNDLEYVPDGIYNLRGIIEILSLRANDLVNLPDFIGEFYNLKELYLNQNRLVVLPPSLAKLKQFRENQRNAENLVLELEGNYFVPPIMSRLGDNIQLMDFISEADYNGLYRKQIELNPTPPVKRDKSKKVSRKVKA